LKITRHWSLIRIEWNSLNVPRNRSRRFDGGTSRSSMRLAALSISSLRFAGRAKPVKFTHKPITEQRFGLSITERLDHKGIYRIPVYGRNLSAAAPSSF
jgi:hypothetical protein